MAIIRRKSGFALLIAVIFMSVMLTFGLVLGSIAYKQQVLASSAIASQYAYYAADAGLECLLYYDQQLNAFAYPAVQPPTAPGLTCNGVGSQFTSAYPTGIVSYDATRWIISERIPISSNRCVDVTIYKPNGVGTTYFFSQGYDVSCTILANPSGARFVSRGVGARY